MKLRHPSRTTTRRPSGRAATRPIPVVVLSESQPITVVTSDGQPLLQIVAGPAGPTIRLVQDTLRLETAGSLELAAQSITLEAQDDVTVKGRTVRLN